MATQAILNISFNRLANADLASIWLWNAEHYGIDHADRYRKQILEVIKAIAQNPQIGLPVEQRPDVRRFTIRKRSKSHGHVVFFQIGPNTLTVVRILHTSQNWQDSV